MLVMKFWGRRPILHRMHFFRTSWMLLKHLDLHFFRSESICVFRVLAGTPSWILSIMKREWKPRRRLEALECIRSFSQMDPLIKSKDFPPVSSISVDPRWLVNELVVGNFSLVFNSINAFILLFIMFAEILNYIFNKEIYLPLASISPPQFFSIPSTCFDFY